VTRQDFDLALLRYGSNLDRWPPELAAKARRLVEGDPLAVKMLTEAVALDRAVAEAVQPPEFGAAEIGRILQTIDAEPEAWTPSRWFWIAGAGASALSFAAGFAVMLMLQSASQALSPELVGLAIGNAEIGGLL
jgi:hypothetical protein